MVQDHQVIKRKSLNSLSHLNLSEITIESKWNHINYWSLNVFTKPSICRLVPALITLILQNRKKIREHKQSGYMAENGILWKVLRYQFLVKPKFNKGSSRILNYPFELKFMNFVSFANSAYWGWCIFWWSSNQITCELARFYLIHNSM